MLLDLSEIVIRNGMRTAFEVNQERVEDPDLEFAEPIRGRLTFENSGDLLNIQGHAETALAIPCSRCLAEVRLPVELEVSEHFPIDEVLHPDRKPDPDSDPDTLVSSVVYIDQGRPILDLDELLRQLIVTEVPIRTLCSDACAGLCPRCGVNRNERPCACAEETSHHPLAALGSLLQNGGGD